MTGPEHYREAERLLGLAEEQCEQYASATDPRTEAYHFQQATWAQQRAQVHATLAMTAATFIGGGAGLPADSATAQAFRAVVIL